ncbi:MAG: hypothetical protein CM15mP40_13740 [Alphaproteobacteria bacterium]|nr:MAG: hypothetical protein CM15mP40_13740 [Alphaproteobacteria bacterium]
MSDISKVMKMIKDKEVKFVDLRFTDTKGKWQHTAQTVETIDESTFEDGIMFDGSSIAGWKSIDKADMILKPDPSTAVMDPFTAQPQLVLFCDVIEPDDGKPYELDPRSTGKSRRIFKSNLVLVILLFLVLKLNFLSLMMSNGQLIRNILFTVLIQKKGHITLEPRWKVEIWDIDQKTKVDIFLFLL